MERKDSRLRNGYKTEEKFVLECLERNITVSRPIFNIEPYDFIVEKENKLYTIQVRKSWKDSKNRNMVCLKTSYPRSDKVNLTSQNTKIDFLATLTEDNDWYIIPRMAIAHIKANISVSRQGNYKRYINNFEFNS